MFDPLKNEIIARYSAVELFFKDTQHFRGDSAQIAKGIAFVQIYAVYEYTVVSVFRTALDGIMKHRIATTDLTPTLLAIFLDPEIQSVQDSSATSKWQSRFRLFEKVCSKKPASVGNTVFPKDGSHFRNTQLRLLFEILGIKRFPVQRRRHLGRIDEVVNNRNSIAHGGETAEDVGRRYSRADILHSIRQMKSVCLLLISAIKKQCATPAAHKRR
jgi:hypothetical protein